MTNTGATLYHENPDGTFTATFYPAVFWSDSSSAVTNKDGMTHSHSAIVRIPTESGINANEGNDFFVKGKGAIIDNSSEKNIAQSIKALGKVYSIIAIADKRYGSKPMWHWEFSLR